MTKTKIKSELLLASKNSTTGDILYTWRLTYPRIVLAENLTHRVFSRNTSSTRAIPTMKMIKTVIKDMFVPSYIGTAQKGMQAGSELTGFRRFATETVWKLAGYSAALFSYLLYKLGVAKQISGRLVEPFSWVTQILSGTDVKNFLLLRNHKDAEPHFHLLAAQMAKQVDYVRTNFEYMESIGQKSWSGGSPSYLNVNRQQILAPGEWHLPFTHADSLPIELAKRVDAARCARTSFTLLDTGKVPSVEADLKVCEKLFGGEIKHLSPTEHQAEAMYYSEYVGNFRGWHQFRYDIPGQNPDAA